MVASTKFCVSFAALYDFCAAAYAGWIAPEIAGQNGLKFAEAIFRHWRSQEDLTLLKKRATPRSAEKFGT